MSNNFSYKPYTMKNKISIGLFGFGVVAQGLVHVLKQTQGDRIRIKKICIKDPGKTRSLPGSLFTTDEDELLSDPEIKLIVELIDDAEAACRIVKKSLQAGKQTVSANKKMLAGHLPEFIALQKKNNVSLLYEPSSCGSIPIIRNLEEYYDNDLLQSITGILNGSSNYILSKMTVQGIDYAEALLRAQHLGFAESDPTLDVEGIDALNKLVIITLHAFGLYVSPADVFSHGISGISSRDIQFAREKGRKIKLVGQVCKNPDNTLSMYVMPRMVSPDKYIFNVEDEFNGVVIKGAFYDKQFMFGKGAGGYPTGSAVLSDITALGYGYRYEYKKMKTQNGLTFSNQAFINVYLRYLSESDLEFFRFEEISERYLSDEFRYVIGAITLENLLHAANHQGKRNFFVAEFPSGISKQSLFPGLSI
jgi:homoserine dehydrogenase